MSVILRTAVAAGLLFLAGACPAHASPPVASGPPELPQCETVTVFVGPAQPNVTVCRPLA